MCCVLLSTLLDVFHGLYVCRQVRCDWQLWQICEGFLRGTIGFTSTHPSGNVVQLIRKSFSGTLSLA